MRKSLHVRRPQALITLCCKEEKRLRTQNRHIPEFCKLRQKDKSLKHERQEYRTALRETIVPFKWKKIVSASTHITDQIILT
ncbi:MAG: hypothetical protein ABIG84_00530 [archaeon]